MLVARNVNCSAVKIAVITLGMKVPGRGRCAPEAHPVRGSKGTALLLAF